MSRTEHLHLFEGYGIELEYMIVDKTTLSVRPISDWLLREAGAEKDGVLENEVEFGDMAWSNELVMHVIEMKTNGPTPDLAGLSKNFQVEINRINALLAKQNAQLMPTAMHPFFDPDREMKLWIHDSREIYDAYNRIFDCRGHGWSNLQSVHINLPFFSDSKPDDEFGVLHAAVRLVLPILPALAASSPLYGGRASGILDNRLEFYRGNQRAVPIITGGVIPEQAFTKAAYDEQIFQRVYAAIKPHDPAGILQDEWLNSRGAIARFQRHAVEIRVLDIQETPKADQAVITLTVGAVKALAQEAFIDLDKQQAWTAEPLRKIFGDCLKSGGDALIDDRAYLDAFHYPGKSPARAQDLWRHIAERVNRLETVPLAACAAELEVILATGCLAKRILTETGATPEAATIKAVYKELCACLADARMFGV